MNSQQKNSRKKRLYLLIPLFVVLLIIIGSLPTNYYIESPGQTFPVSEFIKTNEKKYNNLDLVTVSITRNPANVFQYLWSYTSQFNDRVSSQELLGGQTSDQYEELQNWYMETSEQTAVYYAAKQAGLKPKLHYHGVYVMSIQKNSSFKGKLQIGDTVIGADGHKFKSTQEMMNYFNQKKPGSNVILNIQRNGHRRSIKGKIVRLKNSKRNGIGIQLVEHLTVSTKPKVKIVAENIGGPSAGLMFTLESYEIFTKQDLTKSHKIAGTGTIQADGKVGIIGGVDKKVVAASRSGAEVFFAPTDTTGIKKPQSNYCIAKKTAKKIHTKMKIVPVSNFSDALNYLKKYY